MRLFKKSHLKTTLLLVLIAISVLPALLISSYLLSQFRQINKEVEVEKLQAQTQSAKAEIYFKIKQLSLALEQASTDTNVALAAHTGIFGFRARLKLNSIRNQSQLATSVLLVDTNLRAIEASPLAAELIDHNELNQQFQDSIQQGYKAQFSSHILDTPQMLIEERKIYEKNSIDIKSEQSLIFIAPLILSETQTVDDNAKLTGLLVAIIPLESLYKDIQSVTPLVLLDQITYKTQPLISSISTPKDRISVESRLSFDKNNTDLKLKYSIDKAAAFASVSDLQHEYIIITILFLSIVLGLSIFISGLITKPLKALSDLVQTYAAGNLRPQKVKLNFIEIQSIVYVLYKMAQRINKDQQELETRVEQRTVELKQAVDELSVTLAQLKQTQSQLIESEKMSLLGQLLAGIAHEVNTPVGVSITASSMLTEQIKQLNNKFNNASLTKSELDGFIKQISECSLLVEKNLGRASELIQNFKSVAVSAESENPRIFNVKNLLIDVLQTLKLELEKQQISVTISGEEKLEIYSQSGALAQIISHLILNAVRHAFNHSENNQIVIEFSKIANRLVILFKDNGSGVSDKLLDNLFAPFYDHLNKNNNTGLGLNIVHNLTTQALKGEIKAFHAKPSGLVFEIYIPLK
ncbi:sensor histidine kinase [Catenovulum maritimum]|uniref:sensor histidine kinase n=1 Tax=Catenovulum maritimum TaxID=1513271 RepID=UPI00065FACE3|nr:HAMP domain-containing sensor histidine kinase [Catenovulum maritimum]